MKGGKRVPIIITKVVLCEMTGEIKVEKWQISKQNCISMSIKIGSIVSDSLGLAQLKQPVGKRLASV